VSVGEIFESLAYDFLEQLLFLDVAKMTQWNLLRRYHLVGRYSNWKELLKHLVDQTVVLYLDFQPLMA